MLEFDDTTVRFVGVAGIDGFGFIRCGELVHRFVESRGAGTAPAAASTAAGGW